MSLYFTETQDISYKHISQTDYQYFMTKRKNARMYTPKINYLTIILHSICGKPHITFNRDIHISLMNKLLSTNSNYQNVLLQI